MARKRQIELGTIDYRGRTFTYSAEPSEDGEHQENRVVVYRENGEVSDIWCEAASVSTILDWIMSNWDTEADLLGIDRP